MKGNKGLDHILHKIKYDKKKSEVAGMVNGWMLVYSLRRARSFFWKLIDVTEYHMYSIHSYVSPGDLHWNQESCHDSSMILVRWLLWLQRNRCSKHKTATIMRYVFFA